MSKGARRNCLKLVCTEVESIIVLKTFLSSVNFGLKRDEEDGNVV